ncbi:MAG: carbon storage regulator [Gemmatimonadota bacterium]|jgi:carbon storage regulator
MLILSRRPGDAILIDGGIRIVVVACDSRGVRLGIEAPGNVGIVREEIVKQIADENRRANTAALASQWMEGLPPPPPREDRPEPAAHPDQHRPQPTRQDRTDRPASRGAERER